MEKQPRFTKTQAAKLFAKAHEAGNAAAVAARPTPMVVGTPKNLMGSLTGGDDGGFDETQPVYYVAAGVCGFAWVTVPGNSSFGRWLKSTGKGSSMYGGGTGFYVHSFGQSMELKEAYARAFVKVLQEAGVSAWYSSRMD